VLVIGWRRDQAKGLMGGEGAPAISLYGALANADY